MGSDLSITITRKITDKIDLVILLRVQFAFCLFKTIFLPTVIKDSPKIKLSSEF